MSLSDDVVRATCWLNEISIELNRCALDHDRQSRLLGKQIKEASEAQALEYARVALKHDAESRRLLAKAAVVAACAQLSDDKPLRVRLMPDVFLLMRV